MRLKARKLSGAKVAGQISGPPPSMPVRGVFLDNDSPHNFAKLGESFLKAATFSNEGFQNRFEWPTYFLAFQALELYLKSYLLGRGRHADYVRNKIGHNLRRALDEAKAGGLDLNARPGLEELVRKVGDAYCKRDFQYRSVGEWTLTPPGVLIAFVEQVRSASGN